jgi:hyperosmotically inducible protein
MKPQVLCRFLGAMLLVGAGIAGASTIPADTDIARKITHEVRMYPRYTMWDDINFRVHDGQVELLGAVSQPYKKSDIERLVQRVPGVTSVADEIKVLPLSAMDDRLRIQVARAIFRDPVLSRYAMGAVPSIHIIVDNGHVTLAGVVDDEMAKNVAGIRANGAGLSFGAVTNNLRVEHPARKS